MVCVHKLWSINGYVTCVCLCVWPNTDVSRRWSANSSLTSLYSASYASCKRGTAHIYCCTPCCGSVLLWCRPCSNQQMSPAHQAHSSKPAARYYNGQMGQTDRWMDGRTPYHYKDTAPHTMQAMPIHVIKTQTTESI